MTEKNVALIQQAYAAWNRAGLDAFSEYWAEDARWQSIPGAPDDRGPMRGWSHVRAYLEDWLETFDDFRVEPVELIDAGAGRVVAVLRYSGHIRHSDMEVPGLLAALFVVRHGRIVDGGEYETRAQALEAATLSD
jgi:ketosteroid isomerase-like protein